MTDGHERQVRYSVVVPPYNEKDSILTLYEELEDEEPVRRSISIEVPA